ncbi:MAG TPA: hypothetical protein VFX58_20090 [Chitinophagaceae bacterium]|nr:hypothetical protein [Chitinophagaceae bacterium]
MKFLAELRQRNLLLYWFGWFNFIVGMICFTGLFLDETQLLGVNRWLKPMKFYLSVGLMIWTMGWLMHYLDDKKKVHRYSWIIVFSMFFENGLILLQAIRSTTSHFNNKTATDSIIFSFMGLFILIFTIVCVLICIEFFRQKTFSIPASYVWGIRLGLLFFIIFSIEGGMMLGLSKHTVGAADGEAGLPLLNWSREYGDLRIAHFFGLHSLQLLPLAGCYIFRSRNHMILAAMGWFLVISFVFIQALNGRPLIPA